MKEIGGYIELDTYTGLMMYDDAIKLNCGRNALDYLLEIKKIKKLFVPKFMCDSNNEVQKKHGVQIKYFSIGKDFKPIIRNRKEDEWIYLVNYYGQILNDYIMSLGENIIVDNAQAFFQEPIKGYDTIYSCRKFFGVSDGALLYTDKIIEKIPQDESYSRVQFLFGRFERSASEFYSEYVENNNRFKNEPIKRMSKLTENMLHAIDYEYVKKKRTHNFMFLHKELKQYNKLQLSVPEGAFMYPFYIENGAEIREKLLEKKIYIPILWPEVLKICKDSELEYDMAKNILPLPIDQRYDMKEMEYMATEIKKYLVEEI